MASDWKVQGADYEYREGDGGQPAIPVEFDRHNGGTLAILIFAVRVRAFSRIVPKRASDISRTQTYHLRPTMLQLIADSAENRC